MQAGRPHHNKAAQRLPSLPSFASSFRDLVSGRRRGFGAAASRTLLRGAELVYAAGIRLRNYRYDAGRLPIDRVDVPVVSVGNVTLGGTGKTPMVEWLAHWYRARGVRVVLVSRGYGAEQGAANDEALELEQRLPDVPHVQNPDRVAASKMAIEEFESQLVILDDGFQHRRLARDLDIVLIDALEPFGFEHVFPRGTLREPLGGLARAQVIALSRADAVSAEDRSAIEKRIRRYAPAATWIEVSHPPRRLVNAAGQQEPLGTIAGRRVAAFCGIGNPAGFRHTLTSTGANVVALREFPDHHAYTREDVESLSQWVASLNVDAVVCTGKDLVKLRVESLGGLPLWALAIELEIGRGREDFEVRLSKVLV
ncbi:MAG TPA: tetraacyldisaccharide 4'-kinase [Pirellulales bacterium]|jgi:tetraacyldisaccharide 4'-kinase|nr:tetraacyldisaccharide 4'-kinase [Pirellulales bacterium]